MKSQEVGVQRKGRHDKMFGMGYELSFGKMFGMETLLWKRLSFIYIPLKFLRMHS